MQKSTARSLTFTAAVTAAVMLTVCCASVVTVAAGSISQGVTSNGQLAEGVLVSLSESSPRQVELANLNNSQYLFGVVSVSGQTLAEIETGEGEERVSTEGDVSVIVSTINGDIAAGDVIGVSSLDGVGALAAGESRATTTIGIALSDFNAGSLGAKLVTATDDNGVESQVLVGSIPVRLAVNNFFVAQSVDHNLLTSVGEQIIGKSVSSVQVLVGAALALAGILVGGAIIWNAVHGSFISLGRNPLSGRSVFSGLFYVTLLSIAVMVGGLVAGYLILLV